MDARGVGVFSSLRNRIVLLACCVASLTSVSIGSLYYRHTIAITTDTAIEGLAGETRLMALKFKDGYDDMRDDVYIVASTPTFVGIVSAKRSGIRRGADVTTLPTWRHRLETLFISFLKNRPYYTQMRLIGLTDNGREIVRVNRVENGFERVTADKLQEKSGEPYFVTGTSLQSGQYRFSEVSYNREYGRVTEQRVPTERLIIPIFDTDRTRLGLLVINADLETLLRHLFRIVRPTKEVTVFDQNGNYMSFVPGAAEPLLEVNSHYTRPIADHVSKVLQLTEDETLTSDDDHLSYTVRLPVNPDGSVFLGLSIRVPTDTLLASAYQARHKALIISLVIVIITCVAAYVAARWLTAPLQAMTDDIVVSTNKPGNHVELHLPVHRHDEIGDLARAFDSLSRALVESEARARVILENASDGIITIDQDGLIDEFNRASERIFGYCPEEIVGKSVNVLIPESYRDLHDRHISQFLAEETNIGGQHRANPMTEGLRKDGSTFPLEISISKVAYRDGRVITGILRDISDRVKQESDRDNLIKQLTVYNQELDDFAYIASHDLKAPLRVIDNASRWLEEDLADYLNDDTRESLRLLRSRVVRMEKMLDDLLDYHRIGRYSDDRFREVVSGDALMENVLALLAPPDGMHVSIDDDVRNVQVKRMPLQQVMANLIGNAIKHHGDDEGHITVSVESSEDHYTFVVADDGPGIPKEFQQQVLKLFQTLKPRDRIEGSGMGLAMVKKNVEKLGGTLVLESEPMQGCTVRFTWPKSQLR